MSDLTSQQAKLLEFIKKYIKAKGYAPSLREMADYLGVRAVSTVHQHLQALRNKVYVEIVPNKERGVTAGDMPKVPKLIRIPLLGEIAAGLPLEPIEDPEPVFVSTQIAKNSKDYYALKVRGDSMIEDGIQDGDIIVAKTQNYIDGLNQIVVAVKDGEATLKRFGGLTHDGRVKLLPRNPRVPIILADPATFEVRGIFVGLVRGI